MTEQTLKPVRLAGWEVALVDCVHAIQEQTAKWGSSDCLTRIGDLALAMTNVDPMADIRGTYSDAKGAAGVLKDLGFADIDAALTATFEELAPSMARRGDCGLVLTEVGKKSVQAAVIIMGDMVMGCPEMGKTDPVWWPREQLAKAYRIG